MPGPNGAMEPDHEERYRQLVELAPDGILVHDGDRIVLANAAAVRLVGGTHRDQVIGQPIDAFLDPPYLKSLESRLLSPAGPVDEPAVPLRDTLRRLDGSNLEVDLQTTAFMDRGRASVHVVIRDISERLATEQRIREIEDRLNQAQRMEAVGALAGGVAHEINNQMSVVLGFADLLLREDDLPARMRSDARQIARAAQRAALVTGQLLSFSRRGFHEPRVLDLGTAVRDAEPVIRRLLGETRRLELTTEGTPLVRIDPRQLDQVVLNLALNARDAMADGGTLTVSTSEVEVTEGRVAAFGSLIPAARYGLVTMRDTGVGMDRITQARIFEPFFTTKAIGEGSGLGLAASYGIMKQSDGFIAVTSAPGHGTELSLYFPIVAEPAAGERRQSPRPPIEHRRGQEATVLLVEDEPGVRAIAARILTTAGFRVLEAPNGARALAIVDRDGPPDLVLSDVVMPGMGGAELARRLRARWPGLPVLFMSGYSDEELRQHGALGTDPIAIPKPFTTERLLASVSDALVQWHAKSAPQT